MRRDWTLSPGTLIGVAALVLALAGTSVAAQSIGKDAVGAKELGPVKLRSQETVIPGGEMAEVSVSCKRGEQLLGGGATYPDSDPVERPSVEHSGPVTKRKWLAVGSNDDSALEATLRLTVLCLKK